MVRAVEPVLRAEIPDPAAQYREGESADQGSGRADTDRRRLDGAEPAGLAPGRRSAPGDGGRGRLRPKDPLGRIRHLTAGGDEGEFPDVPDRLEWPDRSR